MSTDPVRESVARYYTGTLAAHGPTFRGVDWNSEASQDLRFTQLLRVVDRREASINDYGCGYGALAARLRRDGHVGTYQGYDLAEAMTAAASVQHAATSATRFTSRRDELETADYTLASGIFNVRLDTPVDAWERYIRETLDDMARVSRRGFAFNLLTLHSDPSRRREDLYYADPAGWLADCLARYTPHIALLHDYALFEFTVLVRLEVEG